MKLSEVPAQAVIIKKPELPNEENKDQDLLAEKINRFHFLVMGGSKSGKKSFMLSYANSDVGEDEAPKIISNDGTIQKRVQVPHDVTIVLHK